MPADPVADADDAMEETEGQQSISRNEFQQKMDQMMAQMQYMFQRQQLQQAVAEPGSPAQPGTPRELELQAELEELKRQQAQELAARKAELAAKIFCSCTTSGCCTKGKTCNCTNPAKTGGQPKPCTARCGCRGIATVCFNPATPGVAARLEKEEQLKKAPIVNFNAMSDVEIMDYMKNRKEGQE